MAGVDCAIPSLLRARRWLLIAAAYWTLNGLAEAARAYVLDTGRPPLTWGWALTRSMTTSLLWVPATVAIFWLVYRFPLERGRWRRNLAIHTGANVVAAIVRGLAIYLVSPWAGLYRVMPPVSDVLVHSLAQNFFFYWMVAGAGHALLFAETARARDRRAAELEVGLARARLHALKSRLQPHFLFNTMNSIAELMHQDPEAADRMIGHLSELLRQSLDSAETQEVTLADELATLAPYVQIELARFGDRLRISQAIDPEVLAARVPHFLLQPLVENAVRHGIGPRARPGRVLISARRRGQDLELQVLDDGVGPGKGNGNGNGNGNGGRGLGLALTRERLATLYGAHQRCELLPAEEGGALASIRIPFRVEEPRR